MLSIRKKSKQKLQDLILNDPHHAEEEQMTVRLDYANRPRPETEDVREAIAFFRLRHHGDTIEGQYGRILCDYVAWKCRRQAARYKKHINTGNNLEKRRAKNRVLDAKRRFLHKDRIKARRLELAMLKKASKFPSQREISAQYATIQK